jgi:hypothetical protein
MKTVTVVMWFWCAWLTWQVYELHLDHINAGSQMDVTADRVGDLEKRVTALERAK